MKTTVLLSILFASTLSFAKDVQNSTINVAPSNIAQVFTLVDKSTDGVNKKLNIVVEDTGKSTDMSARYKVYLGYAKTAQAKMNILRPFLT